MLRVVRVFSVLPVLLLGACASSPPPKVSEVDQQKVAAVDRAALRHGIKVMWVTLPTKRAVAPS
jgi:hypothetical protein